MLPGAAIDDGLNRGERYAVLGGEGDVVWILRMRSTNCSNVSLGELGAAMLAASKTWPIPGFKSEFIGTQIVLAASHVFKIAHMIIGSIAVDMIDFFANWAGTDERKRYKAMQLRLFLNAIFAERHARPALSMVRALYSACSYIAHKAGVAHRVRAFVAFYWFPALRHIWKYTIL